MTETNYDLRDVVCSSDGCASSATIDLTTDHGWSLVTTHAEPSAEQIVVQREAHERNNALLEPRFQHAFEARYVAVETILCPTCQSS